MRSFLKFCLACSFVWAPGCAMGYAQSAATLYTFPPTYNGSGANPIGLIADAAGNLYGVAVNGGPTTTGITCLPPGCGEIYELVNPGNSFQPWTEKTLYAFAGSDGCEPEGRLTMGYAGNLYGVESGDGCDKIAAVFELSPSDGGAWTKQTIYTSSGGGVNPALAIDSDGNLYGTSSSYAFELVAPAAPGGVWNFEQIAIVADATGGLAWFGGRLYGTAHSSAGYPYGQVFEIAKVPGGKGTWAATAIATFAGGTDGEVPPVYPEPPVQALSLTMPKAGVIFGLSTATVYELRKQSDGTWVKTNLSSYDGGDGSSAWALTASANGKHLFAPGGPSGGGATEWSAPTDGGTAWTANTFSFPEASGVSPMGNVVIDDDGLGIFLTSYFTTSAVEHVSGLVPIGAPFKTLDEQGSACIQVSYPATGEVKLTNTCARVVDFWYCAQAGAKGTDACTEPGSNLGIFDTGYLDAKKSVALAVTLGAGQVASGWAQSCDEGEYPVLTTNKKGVQSLDCGVPVN
jgi:hypothetical protein